MNNAKIDNSIFIKAMIGLIVEFIFDLPVRFVKILFLLALTSMLVIVGAFIFYWILEVIINLFVDFKLDEEKQWIAVSGISCWIGIYIGVNSFADKDSLVKDGFELFDFSKYSIAYNKINSGIISKKLAGQSHIQEINLSSKIQEFWKTHKPIKISDLKKSKDIEVLGEKPQGWLLLKYGIYKFVAKYGKEEKKLKAVQVFSRKEKSFVDSLGTDNETKSLLEYMVQKEYRVLYVPFYFPREASSVELFKKKYKKDKDYEKRKEVFLTHNTNRFDRLYDHINNYFNFQIAEKENQIRITVKNREKLVTRLKDEIKKDFASFFQCIEKIGNTYLVNDYDIN